MKKVFLFLFLLCCVGIAVPAFSQEVQQNWINALQWIVRPMEDGLPQACWFCPIYREMFILLNNMGVVAADTLRDFFVIVLWLGALAFILFHIGKQFVSFKEMDMREFLSSLLIPMGKVIIAAAILGNIQSIYYWIINPALQTSIGIGQTLLDTAETSGQQAETEAILSQAGMENFTTGCNESSLADLSADRLISSGLLYENSTYKKVLCYMSTAGMSLSVGMSLGIALVDYAFEEGWYKHFRQLWIGLLIAVSYLSLLIMFGIKLIDPLIRLTIVSALLPLWVILWVFPATSGYTKKAWEALISVMGTFIMLSIMLSIIIPVMGRALGTPDQVDEIFGHMTSGTITGDTFRYVNWKVSLWCLGYAMICWKLLGSVEGLVKTFAAGGSDGKEAERTMEAIGMKIVALGAMLMKSTGRLGGAAVMGTVKGGAKGIGWIRERRRARRTGGNEGSNEGSNDPVPETPPADSKKYEGDKDGHENPKPDKDEHENPKPGEKKENDEPGSTGDSAKETSAAT